MHGILNFAKIEVYIFCCQYVLQKENETKTKTQYETSRQKMKHSEELSGLKFCFSRMVINVH